MNETQPIQYLTVEGACDELTRLGFMASLDHVRKMARERKLPFFKLGKRLYIARDELTMHYRRSQIAAVKAVRSNEG